MLPHGTCDSHTCKPTCKSNFSRKSSDSYQWKFHVSMCGVFCSDHLQFCSGKYVSVTCCLGSAMCDCFHGFAEAGLRAASAQMPKLEESSPVRFSAWCSRQLCFFWDRAAHFARVRELMRRCQDRIQKEWPGADSRVGPQDLPSHAEKLPWSLT